MRSVCKVSSMETIGNEDREVTGPGGVEKMISGSFALCEVGNTKFDIFKGIHSAFLVSEDLFKVNKLRKGKEGCYLFTDSLKSHTCYVGDPMSTVCLAALPLVLVFTTFNKLRN